MIIYGVAGSPFCRKTWLATIVAGLTDTVGLAAVDLAKKEDRALISNPLGKVPVLRPDDGRIIYDSATIVDVLDEMSGGKLVGQGADRSAMLTVQALADGVLDAASLQVQEARFHSPEAISEKWIAFQAGKVARGLAEMEARPPEILNSMPRIDAIATACVLGYLDKRFDGTWRQQHPRLVAFLHSFQNDVPSFDATGNATVFGQMPAS